ncbi:MAG: multiple sugar transport system substrate-binding protein, partial [Kosmotogales bacterium]|nr:multiple sugar transport system substrate-binding protein [Kosmotogales bacterium]
MKKVIILLIIFISFVSFAFSKDEIVFWYAWGGHEGDALLELVNEFNGMQDDLYVRAVYVPIGGGEKIMATLAGNSTPDVVTVWDWMVVPLGYNGALLPLNDLLISAGYDENAYLPNIWNYGVYEDVKYGVPTTLNLYAFMWNKNLFEEFGLDSDNPPTDIEQLNEYNDIFFKEDSRGNIRRLGFLP